MTQDKAKAKTLATLAKDIPKLAAAASTLGSPLLCSILDYAREEIEIELAKLQEAQALPAAGRAQGPSSSEG